MSEQRADFCRFITMWNRQENRGTPDLHLKIAEWLERNWRAGKIKLLLMAFRSSGKSTLVGLFAAWLLYTRPDLRILVLAADFALAAKMVQQVRKIIERHALTQHLKPKRADQWAAGRFTVKRPSKLRDPSMLARGVTSNITGSRADIVICDDVEVPNTSDSADKRAALRERLDEISYVLVPGGTQLYVGTPHTYFSIYAEAPRLEIAEEKVYLPGFERLSIPVTDGKGVSAWPEKYTAEAIEKIKTQSGPNKFASQMMLKPLSVSEGRLDSGLLNIYGDELDYAKELNTLFLGQKKMASASAWWDPAFGSAKGDRSVLAVVFTDEEGNYYLHHVEYIKVSGGEIDEATEQCRTVAQIAREFYLPSVTVEMNGIGGFLPGLLRNEINRMKVSCGVKQFMNHKPKDARILEAFDALLAARRIYAHRSVLQTPFIMEMKEWRPFTKNARDDGLDAAAGAISQEPVRLVKIHGEARQEWMHGSRGHKAKTTFEV